MLILSFSMFLQFSQQYSLFCIWWSSSEIKKNSFVRSFQILNHLKYQSQNIGSFNSLFGPFLRPICPNMSCDFGYRGLEVQYLWWNLERKVYNLWWNFKFVTFSRVDKNESEINMFWVFRWLSFANCFYERLTISHLYLTCLV